MRELRRRGSVWLGLAFVLGLGVGPLLAQQGPEQEPLPTKRVLRWPPGGNQEIGTVAQATTQTVAQAFAGLPAAVRLWTPGSVGVGAGKLSVVIVFREN